MGINYTAYVVKGIYIPHNVMFPDEMYEDDNYDFVDKYVIRDHMCGEYAVFGEKLIAIDLYDSSVPVEIPPLTEEDKTRIFDIIKPVMDKVGVGDYAKSPDSIKIFGFMHVY